MKKYAVLMPLMHQGVHTPKGATVMLSDEQAASVSDRVVLIEAAEPAKTNEPPKGGDPNTDNQKGK